MPDTAPVHSLVDQYAALQGELPGAALPWLRELRTAGIERFAALGLPTPRVEAWKYTRLRPLETTGFAAAPAADPISIRELPALLPQSGIGHRVVFVNGRLRQCISTPGELPEGVEFGGLAEALRHDPEAVAETLGRIGELDDQPMLALNTAMMRDGLALRIKRGVSVPLPIEVVYVGAAGPTPLAFHPRNLIVLEPGSHATLVEYHVGLGNGAYFANSGTEVRVGEGAELHHYKVQEEGAEALHVATLHARLGRDALYDGFNLTTGARLARSEIAVQLAGEGADCRLNGAYMVRGRQHCDTTTAIDHLKPETSCHEVFKGVIDEQARAVFQGRIVVHPDAQRSSGHQLSKALLLSDQAEIDAKPELEIYADDVKCSHGATAGELDADALFYLRSRGLAAADAKRLLIEAFVGETVEAVADAAVRAHLWRRLRGWLAKSGET